MEYFLLYWTPRLFCTPWKKQRPSAGMLTISFPFSSRYTWNSFQGQSSSSSSWLLDKKFVFPYLSKVTGIVKFYLNICLLLQFCEEICKYKIKCTFLHLLVVGLVSLGWCLCLSLGLDFMVVGLMCCWRNWLSFSSWDCFSFELFFLPLLHSFHSLSSHFCCHFLFLEYVRRKYPLRNCGLQWIFRR